MSGLKPRDKIELVIAGLIILIWIIGFELTGWGGSPTWPTRIIVLAATFTMFGDNVAKARELLTVKENANG